MEMVVQGKVRISFEQAVLKYNVSSYWSTSDHSLYPSPIA